MFAKPNDSVQPLSTAGQAPSLTVPTVKDTEDQISTISRGVTVVGKILGEGAIQVFGFPSIAIDRRECAL
jgi:hypothetical protein